MNHCVPDWDGNVGELDAFLASSPDVYLSPVKSKWESSPHRRRDCDTVEHDWTDNGLIAMQENESKGSNPQWQNCGNNWSGGDHDSEDAVTPSKPRSNSTPGKDGDSGGALVGNGSAGDTTPPAAVAAPPPPLPPIPRPSDDDEMTSWLYPIEASLEKNYCSEFFGDLPNSDISGIHFGREPFAEGPSAAAVRSIRNSVTPFTTLSSVNNMCGGGGSSSLHRASSADAAMALGAGRAAGLLPQAGVEAFTKVRTTMQQPHAGGKGPPLRPNPNSPAASNAMLPPKSQPSSLQPVGPGNVNFPQFSTLGWRKMQSMAGVPTHSGNGMNRMKSPMKSSLNRVVAAATTSAPESSIVTSTTTKLQSESSRKASFPQVGMEGSSGGQQSLGTESSSWASMQHSKEGEAVVNSAVKIADAVNSEPGPVDQDKCHPTRGSASVKHASQGKEIAEAPEPTITTCSGGSGGSGNCTEQGLEVGSCSKRKAREAEESECQSEDGEEELAEMKKPVRRGSTTKRSRAAEVHNLSERRRRDRINERMKLLQELIPNSNKTDKASMLEEAIDYVKLLHAQLQGVTHELHQRNSYQQMCVPNGMNGMGVGPMVMPAAMQHLQMPLQMGSMPPIGMGMRPMVGMGMMDMGAMAPMRPSHLMPTPSPGSHGGPAPCVSATSPAVSMVDSTDHRLQSNTVMESLNVYLARQQQLQLPSQPMNMNLYNNYAMHQRQQQQQHIQQQQLLHHQQQQQQQQQHQLHLPHMGGGALQ